MKQREIAALLMRGGTSRGPYFLRSDLPSERDELARVLIAAIGAGHPLNINGIGGGNAVTTKVAMLSPSQHEHADVDYFFAQVAVDKQEVDFKPTCGNILAGVGPAAIEMGLVEAHGDTTPVRIHSTNTSALVEAIVETPGGEVNYHGASAIDGVPGTSAPVILNFKNVIGSASGALFPTGNARDMVCDHEVTCIDVAMPMVIGIAADFGISGYESSAELNDNSDLFKRIEQVRCEAGKMMGFGDVSSSVVPKFGLLAAAKEGGTVAGRYFMPWKTHPSYAVTGSICTASCLLCPGTIAARVMDGSGNGFPVAGTVPIKIEHPSGAIDLVMEYSQDGGKFDVIKAGLVRTARLLFRGSVAVEGSVWSP